MNHKRIVSLTLLLIGAVGLLALAACASPTPAAPAPLVVTVKAQDLMFDPMSLTAKVGQPITINFQNTGALEHSFVIDALNVKLEHIQPGQTASVTFTPKAAGTYEFYCDVPGHRDAGMKGTLTVSA